MSPRQEDLFGHPRARQARLGRILGAPWCAAVLMVFAFTALCGGAVLLIWQDQSIGWLLAGLAGPAVALMLWGKQLARVPIIPDSEQLADRLESRLLARLPKDATLQDVAKLIEAMPGGRFFANRFMLGKGFLEQLAVDESTQLSAVLERAQALTSQGLPITAAELAAALMLESKNLAGYIAQVGLDEEDIIAGVRWSQHLAELTKTHQQKRATGGIGRDWAFGYTPLLERFGHNISDQVSGGLIVRKLESRERMVEQMIEMLAKAGRRNVTLVGQLGSGKTKLVQILAERLLYPDGAVPRNLAYNQVIGLDASTLLAQAQNRGQLEQLILRLCNEALTAKNIVLVLDDAHLFFEDGNGSVDLAQALTPYLDGGALKVVLTVNEQRWTQIMQRTPSLSQYLNRLVVQPADEAETYQVMKNQVPLLEYQYHVLYTFQALKAAYMLSGRYIADQVMPGRALSLLESAAHHAEDTLVTRASVEQALEQTRGVKVATASTSEERETLLNLEDKIHERMINQTHAVRAVSDALRRARTGVRNTSRPIGTFLFLGPTGVGKTELAKAVAAVYFGDEQNIVRLDLNEYVRSEDVSRLIADPSQDSHSLTAQISQRPFSVVLLDEIEKAHPEVLTTLLQVLDEGILRDINNREVSFRDAVIIATSNAGAQRIIEHIQAGESLEQFEETFISELIQSGEFRPEFLNRFDEITLFRPLDHSELKQVVGLIIAGVNKTLSSQKLQVQVDDDAIDLLVQAGYDPLLGARPMRRIVQKTVENIVADKVLRQEVTPGSIIRLSAADIQTALARLQAK